MIYVFNGVFHLILPILSVILLTFNRDFLKLDFTFNSFNTVFYIAVKIYCSLRY